MKMSNYTLIIASFLVLAPHLASAGPLCDALNDKISNNESKYKNIAEETSNVQDKKVGNISEHLSNLITKYKDLKRPEPLCKRITIDIDADVKFLCDYLTDNGKKSIADCM